MPLLPALHGIPAFYWRLGFAQQVTAITQAPGFTSLSPCAQNIAVAAIDESNSPECPGGSPPHCFCGAEAASQEYTDQISTNILNSCLTSARTEAVQAATVFAAYCSLGDGTTPGTMAAGITAARTMAKSTTAAAIMTATTMVTATAAKTLSSSYSLSPSSSKAGTSTSSVAQGASSTSTSTSGPASSSNGGGSLAKSNIVARGANIGDTLETIAGIIFAHTSTTTNSSNGGATSTSNGSTTSTSDSGGGLDENDKIGIGIAIAGLVVASLALYIQIKSYNFKKKNLSLASSQARYGARSRYATGTSEVRITPPAATYPSPARNIAFATEEGSASSPFKEGFAPSCEKDPIPSYTPSFSQEGSAPSPSKEGSAPEPITSSTEEGCAPEPIASPTEKGSDSEPMPDPPAPSQGTPRAITPVLQPRNYPQSARNKTLCEPWVEHAPCISRASG